MSSIHRKVLKNLENFKSFPEVYKYFVKNPNCIVCQHKVNEAMLLSEESKAKNLSLGNCENKKITDSISLEQISSKEITKFDCDFLIWLKYLGIKDFTPPLQQTLKNKELNTEKEYVELYCKFLSCLDFSPSNTLFNKFDLLTFSNILNLNIKDEIFTKFIEKLLKDPFVYDKSDKVKGLNIEIFVFSYLSRNKLDTKILKKRIEEHAFLFKPDPSFEIELSGDILIDKMILQLRKNTLDLKQAIFLNQVYLNVSKDREYFDLFHKLLIDSIKSIEQIYIFSFIKHVFTFKTVLFSCIQEEQLLKLILSFYKKINKLESTVGILLTLFNNAHCLKINSLIHFELQEYCLKNKKYTKILKLLEIRSLRKLDDLKDIILQNKDSFESINLVYMQTKLISPFAEQQSTVIQVLEICLELFSKMKNEFLERFLSQIVVIIIEMLNKIVIDESFRLFNLKNWNILSDLILVCQKDNLNEKKKKVSENYQSEKCKLSLKLAKILYLLEDQMILKGISDFVRLKKRAFKIE